jgi:hypothetical protein
MSVLGFVTRYGRLRWRKPVSRSSSASNNGLSSVYRSPEGSRWPQVLLYRPMFWGLASSNAKQYPFFSFETDFVGG